MPESLLFALVATVVVYSGSLVLAAMGGLTSERSGVIDIGLEGKMLAACILTALVGTLSGEAMLGLGAGLAAALALALLHYALTQIYAIDHIISGMAINALALGGANFLNRRYAEELTAPMPVLPLAGLLVVAFAVPIGLAVYVRGSRGGLHLWAVGHAPDKARIMGIRTDRVRLRAQIATGLFSGLAGVLIVTNAGRYVDNMTAGRGFIALAGLIIGGWRPIPAMLACLMFGFFEALQLNLQGTPIAGLELAPELWNALPYLLTVVALAGLLGRSSPPAGLGKP